MYSISFTVSQTHTLKPLIIKNVNLQSDLINYIEHGYTFYILTDIFFIFIFIFGSRIFFLLYMVVSNFINLLLVL